MSEHEHSTRAPVVTPARVIAAVCVIAPFVATLYVPIYDKDKPEVAGFPFFFWWQLLWVAVTAGLMGLAYFVIRREELARKAAAAQPQSADGGGDAENVADSGADTAADSADSDDADGSGGSADSADSADSAEEGDAK
ncbi:hypothetical protein GCM10009839_59790 [Catenulispora yoronensis]|uniref:DUF3311 domain-containing protein n=1 Tax=Catenulispora yoronensis TaxID=450799 RepID=A0ABN2V309_9ACTN